MHTHRSWCRYAKVHGLRVGYKPQHKMWNGHLFIQHRNGCWVRFPLLILKALTSAYLSRAYLLELSEGIINFTRMYLSAQKRTMPPIYYSFSILVINRTSKVIAVSWVCLKSGTSVSEASQWDFVVACSLVFSWATKGERKLCPREVRL